MATRFVTSESVTQGHPDKLCDQVSDAILDELIKQDPYSKVAIEAFATTGMLLIAGEVRTQGYADCQTIAREVLRTAGYDDPVFGIDCHDAAVLTAIHEQSGDIARGIDHDDGSIGAGDQGMMIGYACSETPEYMPLPIMLAHGLTRTLARCREEGIIPYLGPDGKAQVTIEYSSKPRASHVVVSTQHRVGIDQEALRKDVYAHVILPVLKDYIDEQTQVFINPTGSFITGGPEADTGLTGRKIIVDTYGGRARHGGGAFSGKDPTKVDRSAAYAARYVAKHLVAAGCASECEVQLSYAIGIAEPMSIGIETFATSTYDEETLVRAVREVFDLTPLGIITMLDLRRPIYRVTATYGHFGREGFSWERLDRLDALKDALGS